MSAERDDRGRFKKGVSGNPNGRAPLLGPTTAELKATIRAATKPEDIAAIYLKAVTQAKNGNDPARKFVFSTLGLIEILVDVTSAGEKVGPPDAAALAEALAILGAADSH